MSTKVAMKFRGNVLLQSTGRKPEERTNCQTSLFLLPEPGAPAVKYRISIISENHIWICLWSTEKSWINGNQNNSPFSSDAIFYLGRLCLALSAAWEKEKPGTKCAAAVGKENKSTHWLRHFSEEWNAGDKGKLCPSCVIHRGTEMGPAKKRSGSPSTQEAKE